MGKEDRKNAEGYSIQLHMKLLGMLKGVLI